VNLDFLTPLAREGAPAPESPMATVASSHGATLELRGGWLVPATFPDPDAQRQAFVETVGFADTSVIGKTELQVSAGTALALGGGMTLGVATRRDTAWWCPLTPSRVLVIGSRPELSGGDQATTADVTAQFCALRLEGPLVRQLMAKFCALDLRETVAPVGSLRPGSVARTPGLVVVEAPQRLLIMVGAALAEYLWTVVADAADRLGGRPVGSDLLPGELGITRAEVANA
jgi:glycine cleavage system aminomethyltransferase T